MKALFLVSALCLSAPTVTAAQNQETPTTMTSIAINLVVKTKPGQREAFLALWDDYLRARAEANAAQTHYVLALDMQDEELVRITEIYADQQAMEANASEAWFADYMSKVQPLLAAPPEFHMGMAYFTKP